MILSTTPTLQNEDIEEYLGIVSGEAILGTNFVNDAFAYLRDITGGRSEGYEQDLEKARKIAIDEVFLQAKEKGADAIVGLDIDYESIGSGGSSLLMVSVSGTAVKLK